MFSSRPAATESDKADLKTKSDIAPSWSRTIRETVESIVIAFVLAFLFRTFEAEAFVIPTGSMAPTLQGRHKDLFCPQCGYEYRVGSRGDAENGRRPNERFDPPSTGTCPMCRYTFPIRDAATESQAAAKALQTFNGDRILVSKFAYDFGQPKRWDVVVFKYPEDAKTNYIKRLIGLPGETIKIENGDVYVSSDNGQTYEIARKTTADKLLAMLQDVYNNDYLPTQLIEAGWPLRWQNDGRTEAWIAEDGGRGYACDGSQSQPVWLRYYHLLPSDHDWAQVLDGARITARAEPRLIEDFYAYNTGDSRLFQQGHFVGDLAIACELDVQSAAGQIVLELVKGGRSFQAQIDLASGTVNLLIPGLDGYRPSAKTSIRGPGKYSVRFANVDRQLWFFLDDEVVKFDAETTYPDLGNDLPQRIGRVSDYSPVGIASVGAQVRVNHLNIQRDVYYTDTKKESNTGVNTVTLKDDQNDDFDQFFMLGDNSPQSKDSRLWSDGQNYVERRLLIGKAIYIYWPHAWPVSWGVEIPMFGNRISIPFWPNFSRMRRVR
jgi:signal peptidase I